MEVILSLTILIAGILIGYSIETKEKLRMISVVERNKETNKELRQEVELKDLVIYNLKKEILEVKNSLLQVLKETDNILNQNTYDRLDLVRSNTSKYLKEQIDILEEDIKIELSDECNQQ